MTHRESAHAHHLRVQRTARYFTLGGTQGAAELWFVLHGYGQLASDFIKPFAHVANERRLVVAPEALNRFYLVSPGSTPARDRPVGATWMTREDRDSEIADYVEYLDSVYDDVVTRHGAPSAPVWVLGFSQGTATAARWVQHGRVPAARLVCWGGLLPPESDLSAGARAFRGVPLTFVVGEHDQYATPTLVSEQRGQLEAAGVPYDLQTFDGGHAISRRALSVLAGEDVSRAGAGR